MTTAQHRRWFSSLLNGLEGDASTQRPLKQILANDDLCLTSASLLSAKHSPGLRVIFPVRSNLKFVGHRINNDETAESVNVTIQRMGFGEYTDVIERITYLVTDTLGTIRYPMHQGMFMLT